MPHIVNCVLKIIEKFNLNSLSKEDVEKYSGAVLADALKLNPDYVIYNFSELTDTILKHQ